MLLVAPAHAQLTLNIPSISGETPDSPDKVIHILYLYGLILAGLAGFAAFIIGGVMYLTAAGNPSRAEDAKDRLLHAILGLLLTLFSGVTLRIVNPDLFRFNPVAVPDPGAAAIVQPIDLPRGGYLSCQSQGDAGTFCIPVTEGTCGDDPQCGPCVGRGLGAQCTQIQSPESVFQLIACVPTVPCLTAQGGTCPSNFPCSNITGGYQSDWEVVPASACQDSTGPSLECTDEVVFDPALHTCCARRESGLAGNPPQGSGLIVSCYARPDPAPANLEDGVSFGIQANGSGSYDCRWSGSFDAIGCTPEHVFPLPGVYTMRVEVIDLNTSQSAAASCAAGVIASPLVIKNVRTTQEAQTGVKFCGDDRWEIKLTVVNPNEQVFVKIWKDGVLSQDWAILEPTPPSPLASAGGGSVPAFTDTAGTWTATGKFNGALIASWGIQAKVRGVESGVLGFDVKPCMRITNLTTGKTQITIEPDPAYPPFCVEDPWRLDVIGPPNTDVWIQKLYEGAVFTDWKNFSPPQTDAAGNWSLNGNFNRCEIGSWTERARLTDAGGIDRLTDDLPFSIKSCLTVSCADTAATQPAQFTIAGQVSGDRELGAPQITPGSSYECAWIGPGGVVQGPPPSASLCNQTNPVDSSTIAVGSHPVTLRARTVVSDCSTQIVPHPQPPDQSFTDATCTLTVSP